jgi:hypothetical protein
MPKRIAHGVQDYVARHRFLLEWPVKENEKRRKKKEGCGAEER